MHTGDGPADSHRHLADWAVLQVTRYAVAHSATVDDAHVRTDPDRVGPPHAQR